VAALARLIEDDEDEAQLFITALVADPAGGWVARESRRGPLWQGELLGSELALELARNNTREQNSINAQLIVANLFPEADETSAPHANGTTDSSKPQPADEAALSGVLATLAPSVTAVREQVAALAKERAPEFNLVAVNARRVRQQNPFYDQRILIARAARHNAELLNLLKTLGATVNVCPTVRLSEPESWEPLDRALLHLSWYEWLTFVSAPSVTHFLKHYDELGHHRSEIEARRICAIGGRTVTALQEAGIQCDLVLEQFTAEHLAEAVLKPYGARGRSRNTTMLSVGPPELKLELNKFGIYAEAVAAYQLTLPEAGAETGAELREAVFNYVIFNGESAVENLATFVEPQTLPDFLREARVLCSNAEARDAAQAHGLAVHLQLGESSVSGLVRALREDCLSNLFA
jgi:uroporphyrinogen-III synthase